MQAKLLILLQNFGWACGMGRLHNSLVQKVSMHQRQEVKRCVQPLTWHIPTASTLDAQAIVPQSGLTSLTFNQYLISPSTGWIVTLSWPLAWALSSSDVEKAGDSSLKMCFSFQMLLYDSFLSGRSLTMIWLLFSRMTHATYATKLGKTMADGTQKGNGL